MNELSNHELIAFRFLYLTWLLSFSLLIYAGYANYRQDKEQTSLVSYHGRFLKCEAESSEKYSNLCKVDNDTCTEKIESYCGFRKEYFDSEVGARDFWEKKQDDFQLFALVLGIGGTLLFYGIRWGVTGRLRPWISF